jgi:hypothetical protein
MMLCTLFVSGDDLFRERKIGERGGVKGQADLDYGHRFMTGRSHGFDDFEFVGGVPDNRNSVAIYLNEYLAF